MSTTIKPLEVYIKGTKVFPDVNLEATQLSGTSLLDGILGLTESIQTRKLAFIIPSETLKDYPYIMPPMEDGSTNDFHQQGVDSMNSYWNFGNTNLYDVQFDIDADYLWHYRSEIDKYAFNNTKVKTLNFKGTLHHCEGYGTNDWGNPDNPLIYSQFYCFKMFNYCTLLEEINGLVFDSTQQYLYDYSAINPDYTFIFDKFGGFWTPEERHCYAQMFERCHNLTKLDITWPTESNQVTLHGDSFFRMFEGCIKLPDNQVPTFKLVPITDSNYQYGDEPGLIDITEMFQACTKITSVKITNDSWQYIFNATRAFAYSGVHSIDIPATATNLKYVREILGAGLQTGVAQPDWSDSKFVIRTTAPMDFYINGATSDTDLQLFNYGDYDSNQTFINDFGGIYVPDSQLNDWKTLIANQGGTNIAQNCVFGISQL